MKVTLALLEQQPFLRGLTTRQLEILAGDTMFAEFKANDPILGQGMPANQFYLILKGHVNIECPINGEIECIESLGKGDVLGWSWLFPPYYWHFNARAVSPTRTIFFYGTDIRDRCDENHDLGYALIQRVSEIIIKRLQATRRQLIELHLVLNNSACLKT
jgi:CRP/FNR family cyclic AMP-dependent transcriptional regulator